MQDSILAALTTMQLTYFRLSLSWAEPMTNRYLEMNEVDNCEDLDPHERPLSREPTPPPHPTTVALQKLDPTVCAQRILECVRTIETVVLEWDQGPAQCLGHFVAVVEEKEGVRKLRVCEAEEGDRSSSEFESSWSADLPQHDFKLFW